MFVSGAMLLAAYATAAHGNLYFRIKAAALALAGLNALVYHLFVDRRRAAWDAHATPPRAARDGRVSRRSSCGRQSSSPGG